MVVVVLLLLKRTRELALFWFHRDDMAEHEHDEGSMVCVACTCSCVMPAASVERPRGCGRLSDARGIGGPMESQERRYSILNKHIDSDVACGRVEAEQVHQRRNPDS